MSSRRLAMKHGLLLLLLFLTYALVARSQTCDASLSNHVHQRTRLLSVKGCVTVTGVVIGQRAQPDGDIHMLLKVDPGQGTGWLNKKNATVQNGALVFEPICMGKVRQRSAEKACRGFHQNLEIPPNGTHVSITGMHVLDEESGHGWFEIHPVTKIEILRP